MSGESGQSSPSRPLACPPCEDPQGHQYDDDRTNFLYGWNTYPDVRWARLGDPCMWCDHSKCEACPPPRGRTFDEEHADGNERCYYECDTCRPSSDKAVSERA